MSEGEWFDAGAADIEQGHAVVRQVGHEEHMVMVVKQGETVYVTDALCPHKFTMLSGGSFGDGCVTCPQHDATFDLSTGDAGEDTAWAGQLPIHEHRVEAGRLLVRLTTE